MPMPKAPADWTPNADQRDRIASDPRLQKMSRNDLYFFFKPKGDGDFKKAFRERSQQQEKEKAKPRKPSGLVGTLDRVRRAMGGS